MIEILEKYPKNNTNNFLLNMDVIDALNSLPNNSVDMIITSPPYNLGKEYEKKIKMDEYFKWQNKIISICFNKLKNTGSICWQVGYNNSLDKKNPKGHEYFPLEYEFHPIFKSNNFIIKNRIIWAFGHGGNNKSNFSPRHEVIMWYVKSKEYKFNLDSIRVLPKYPGKAGYKKNQKLRKNFIGPPNKNKNYQVVTSTKGGKNPEDVWKDDFQELIEKNLATQSSFFEMQGNFWDIPNINSHHPEKRSIKNSDSKTTTHPCQFPVSLVTRLILGLTDKNDIVVDPFCGSGSTGVSCALSSRKFIGIDKERKYLDISKNRIDEVFEGNFNNIRSDKPVQDHKRSYLWKNFDFDKWELKKKQK